MLMINELLQFLFGYYNGLKSPIGSPQFVIENLSNSKS